MELKPNEMRGLTPEQYIEILAFIQEHHRFGWVEKEKRVTEYPFNIKYVDACYDSRGKDIWSLSMRPPNIRFTTNHFNGLSLPPDGWKYNNLYDWIMDYLTGKWEPTNEFMIDNTSWSDEMVRIQVSPEEHKEVMESVQKIAKSCIGAIEQLDLIENEPDEVVDKKHLLIPILCALQETYYKGVARADLNEKTIQPKK